MITKAELIEVLDMYFEPLFQIIGAIIALGVIVAAYYFIIVPFLKRIH